MSPFIIVLIIIVVLGVFLVGMYNTLIGKKNQVENAFASIDTMLKKRYDLIPNLVATVQQYMQHERETLVGLARRRPLADIVGDGLLHTLLLVLLLKLFWILAIDPLRLGRPQ
jgi:LemA protein